MAGRGQFAYLLLTFILILVLIVVYLILVPSLCALADRFAYIEPDVYCTVFHINR